MTATSIEERALGLRGRVAVRVAVRSPVARPRPLSISCNLPANRKKKRADERTRTADLLITSLLARVLARPHTSGNSAYLGGFR